ncbi:hypothetical protein F4782DRAFT_74937 [Xylaria castorea]|nr:hypothetical protein F4782DRAFT_74937 [Xylaria castorea]
MPTNGDFARIITVHRVEDRLTLIDATTKELSTADQPIAKRRRRGAPREDTGIFTNPDNLPSSPPLTEMSATSSKCKRCTKAASDMVESPIKLQTNLSLGRPRSPSRRPRSTSPTKPKSKDALELLERPIFVKELEGSVVYLPKDVQVLYSQLQKARHKEEVIPCEVRDQVVGMVGEAEARPYCFRREPTAGADALLSALCSIKMEAKAAQQDECHETGWNHLVHSPVLKLVYSSTRLQPTPPLTSQSASLS